MADMLPYGVRRWCRRPTARDFVPQFRAFTAYP